MSDTEHLDFLERMLAGGIHDNADREATQKQIALLKVSIAKHRVFQQGQERLLRVTGPLPSEIGERPEDA